MSSILIPPPPPPQFAGPEYEAWRALYPAWNIWDIVPDEVGITAFIMLTAGIWATCMVALALTSNPLWLGLSLTGVLPGYLALKIMPALIEACLNWLAKRA